MQIDFRKVCLAIAYLMKRWSRFSSFTALQFHVCRDLTRISCSRSYRTLGWSRFVIFRSNVNKDLAVKFSRHFDVPSDLVADSKIRLTSDNCTFGTEARLFRSISSRYNKFLVSSPDPDSYRVWLFLAVGGGGAEEEEWRKGRLPSYY